MSEKKGFRARFAFRSNSRTSSDTEEVKEDLTKDDNRTRLRKSSAPELKQAFRANERRDSNYKPSKLRASRTQSLAQEAWELDKQTGERRDHTALLHSLYDQETTTQELRHARSRVNHIGTLSGETIIKRLTPKLWNSILDHLDITDAASLAFACKAFKTLLNYNPWHALNQPKYRNERISFLLYLDADLPDHLLCFYCAIYHVRIQKGNEMLKPTNVSNPIINCPTKLQSRLRLTVGRTLPFNFVQLVTRAHIYGSEYGISLDSLSKRYKDRPESTSTWSHQTRYTILPRNHHLILRVISTSFASPGLPLSGQRNLLYSSDDNFNPYFSVCPHWRTGELMPSVKCALSHIPIPLDLGGIHKVAHNVTEKFNNTQRKSSTSSLQVVQLCNDCRPIRRCPECPTEYLIEIKLLEDHTTQKNDLLTTKFKHAIMLTRWSDLGDGINQLNSPEWNAVAIPHANTNAKEYNSFEILGRRSVSAEFESIFNPDTIPPQRLISLNPNKESDVGEDSGRWY